MNRLYLFLLGFFLFAQLPAQTWEPIGPKGGVLRCALLQGDSLLVGTSSGVFLSTDDGQTYTPLSVGMDAGDIIDLMEYNGALFACIPNKGIYRSQDGGVTWSLVLKGRYLHQESLGRSRIQVAAGHLVVRNNDDLNDSLYFSANGGDTWFSRPISVFTTYRNPLYGFGNSIFTFGLANVLGPQQGLYRSDDLGQNWVFTGNGINTTIGINHMVQIGDTLYAFNKYIYKSSDGGLNWTQATPDTLINPGSSFAFGPAFFTVSGQTIYARNGGNANVRVASWTPGQPSWQNVGPGTPTTGAGLNMFTVKGTIFMQQFEGPLYTTTGPAQPWNLVVAEGIVSNKANDLFASGSVALATTNTDFLKGNDGSGEFTGVNLPNVDDRLPLQSVARTGSTYLMGVTSGFNTLRLYYSTNQGATWTQGDDTFLLPDGKLRLLDDTIVVTGGDGSVPAVMIVSEQGAILSSLSTGILGFSQVTKVNALTQHNGDWYILSSREFPVATSRMLRRDLPSATTWGFVANQVNGQSFGGLALESWNGELYLGLATGGVFVSADNGASWSERSTGMEGAAVRHLLPLEGYLIASTDKGIFRLDAGDSTWTDLSGNLPVAGWVKTQTSNQYLWALAENGPVWRLELDGNVSVDRELAAPDFSLRPNPASNMVEMIPSRPGQPFVYTLFDATGRVMMTGQGFGATKLDISRLPAGLYHVRLNGGPSRSLLKIQE